jgi:hypothetical protein
MSKNSIKKNLDVHLEFYVHTQSSTRKKKFMAYAKKIIFCATQLLFTWHSLIFLTQVARNLFSLQNFLDEYIIFRCILVDFCSIFLTF